MKKYSARGITSKSAAHPEEESLPGNQSAGGQVRPFNVSATTALPKSVQTKGATGIQRTLDTATLDIARLCRELHDAIDGLGTDEAAVYSALRRGVGGNIARSLDLRTAYHRIYGADLVMDIQGDMSGNELAWALHYMGYLPQTGSGLGSFQVERARSRMLDMDGSALRTYTLLLDYAGSREERQYIHKALAAGHDVPAVITFARRIRGQSAEWLNNHCRLTSSTVMRPVDPAGTSTSTGPISAGVQQQWHDSCTPTTAMAVRGELDPVYALQTHDANPNLYSQHASATSGTAVNPEAAGQQRTLMTGKGGVAVPRSQTTGMGNSITDINGDWINGGRMGINYRYRHIPSDLTMAQAITQINNTVDRGVPVPMRISSSGAGGGHAVSVISRSGSTYSIHDPWDGGIIQVTSAQILNSTFNVAGWNTVTHIGVIQ